MLKLLVLSAISVIGVCVGQILQDGQCHQNTMVESLDLNLLNGTWYEIRITDHPANGDCSSIEFRTSGNEASVVYKTMRQNFYQEHSGGVSNAVNSSQLTLNISSLSDSPINVWVLNIEYEIFALLYGCQNVGTTQRRVYIWQLSRATSFPTVWVEISLENLMTQHFNITNSDLRDVSHSDDACYELPVIEAGQPVVLPGQCQSIAGVTNFDGGRFLGVWQQIRSYYSPNALGNCNRAQYTDGGDRVNVINSEIVNQTLLTQEGYATVSNVTSGLLNVVFELPTGTAESELVVVGTDYNQWAVTYSCINVNNATKQVFSWIVSRSRQLPASAEAEVNAVISTLIDLNDAYYQTTDQSDASCFYLPTPVAGQPVIFGGQCDTNFPVVANFTAENFLDQWYDIERYPSQFQTGQCNNAFYSPGQVPGEIGILNTQVINESLVSINGVGVAVDNGKFQIAFPSTNNLTTDYWVIATDYTSYSLMYSCRNINDHQQQVNFWKLSRTKQLTIEAQGAIFAIVGSQPVLRQNFFEVTDQSAAACFYYPEPQPGRPVVFPGTCEANVPVVPNFNTTQFDGQWFVVEAYPVEPSDGSCVTHQFSTGTGSAAMNFFTTNVFDQLLRTANGQLTLYSNETGGRFTLSIGTGAQIVSYPYYVVATDYIDYALIYSCLEIPGSDFRNIWAWKLSRTKQLSTTGITQINNAMSNIQVLSNDYFEPVDQSDNGCFFFPDLAPGEPVILPGQCDISLPIVQNFNPVEYLGRWRLIESYPADNQIGQCNQANYTVGDFGTILVYNNEVINQTLREINGFATTAPQTGNQTEGKLFVTFPNSNQSTELWILDTDYVSYSFVYGCQNVNDQQRRVWSWKLSRNTSLSDQANNAITAVINNITVLNQRYYQTVDQSDNACFYYPAPGASPTIFRGQCDLTIPTVSNFNATAYLGLWHDIASYTFPFQNGDCPNAYYTLNEQLGLVEVFNTQVLNQTLDTITGTATPISDGKLEVNFPVMGSTVTPYWVLATDYNSYALVYSCVNINDEQRSVVSWKLSRTKSLGATAVTAINAVVNSIPVLDERYYVARDQTPEGCFYYPEPQPGVPVVFPGQCNDNIPVVTNFNLTEFSGVWHEIETYPKIQQTGECVNHDFSIFGNALNMQSYSVIAQSLQLTEGLVTFTNGTDARMTITFYSNGLEYQIPYWIIDTDYENYALAYSCVNQNEDFRGIWSWKLSRSKQLRPVDVTSISNAIANIDVLGNQYYENIDQSPEACFFFPETAPGQQVVFPGQCGNVQAMPNFNATAYLGRWRLIESYPSNNQEGTCNEANYSLQGGLVQVFNTRVINETLDTVTGTAQAAADGSGRLIVSFPSSTEPVELLVLDTDYETYSIVYSCINSATSDQRTVFSWKLSRTNVLSQAAVLAINNTIARIDVLDERYYEVVDRSAAACFYYPEPSNSTVIFRGQCNENVPVQTNFNAAAYAGTWYSIEAYPAPFVGGTCGTVLYEYNQGSGNLLVHNSQVRDQVLNVQYGTAVIIDNAKLQITFENNVTSDYWILATDYSSYSLAYSCENINADYKRVFSWKFSKTKSLTAAAHAAINNVINNVQVLRQQYFLPEGHSEDDCFFYPDNNGGDVLLNGQCPPSSDVPVVTNFDVNAFSGIWHEVARFPSDLQQGECAANDFAPGSQNSTIITQTIVEGEFQTASIIPGSVSTDGRGVISATVAGVPFDALYILDTDYEEYALIYSCREINNSTKQIYSWKLSRSRSGLSPSANSIIDGLVSSNVDLFYRYYTDTDQTNAACFHYPEFPGGLPEVIQLPGPCNDTIRGVGNFDAAAYTGLWLEIESYPDVQQVGDCSRAYYSPGDGNVLVRNTEVIGNYLSETLGTAEVASNDGSGLLNVYFNINGVQVTANYYILATDYTNYALVYSCRNTDDGQRLVSSWKLSRSNTLTAAAHIAMNSVIATTQGLSQQYYQPTDQSDDACFYIPRVTDSAPLFRGRCANVNGVNNFDGNRYAGWWHELERYPVDGNPGQCISSQYTVSGNTIQVVDTSVNNGAASIVAGTVTATTGGRLIRTLANGITEELIVLDTDYDNYALLYSCVDVIFEGQEYRKVWSAKHSKTRDPLSVNVTTINAVIASNPVLEPDFYQAVDQSDQACFHYPEVQGNRVILPGQCDANIPVVNDFDVGAYEGTWYQIERYPQAYENPDSTCIGARYILNSDTSVVSVLNWEQLDGELLTIEGNATVASSDGSAKLDVTLPVFGTNDTVTTSLYVLATDYDSFSLVYSCRNVNHFQRSIGAWKLSRERTLPAAGNAVINDVMSRREELDARYFLSTEQNEACPEPSSGALVKSSALVLLVCFVLQWFY